MTLAIWLHNLDPFLVKLGPIPIRWYGLAYLAGFFVGYLVIKRICKVGISTLKPEHVADLVVAVAIGIFVGGRLGYVFFYDVKLLWTFSDQVPYWGVLAINHGGMASHGGMIGGVIGCYYYAKRHGHSLLHLIDLFAFAAPPGIFFGRMANFINGELLGRPCSPNFPFAVKFPQELYDMPVDQLYRVYHALPPVESVAPGAPGWDASLIVHLIQQGNNTIAHAIEPFLTPRYPSQIFAGLCEGLVVMVVMVLVWGKPRKPGVVTGAFGMTYAVMRVFDEFFRMPDAQIINEEFATFHVTRGQWLSALLFIASAAVFIISLKRDTKPMGGWRKQGLGSGNQGLVKTEK